MKKSLQIQFGISIRDKSVDIIVDHTGLHLHYDNLGDVSGWSDDKVSHFVDKIMERGE